MGNENRALATGYAWQGYHSAEEGCAVAAMHGFDYYYIDGSIHEDFSTEWGPQRVAALRARFDLEHVKPVFHGNFKVPLSSDVEPLRQAAVNYVMSEIDVCAQFGAPLILHGSAVVEPRKITKVKALCLDQFLRSLDTLNGYASAAGVALWLENLPNYPRYRPFHYIFTTDKEFDYVLARVGNMMLFDVGHANINAEVAVPLLVAKYCSRAVAISMSNNEGALDEHRPIDQGTIKFDDLIDALIEQNWRGIVAFETRGVAPSRSVQTFEEICRRREALCAERHACLDAVAQPMSQ